MATKKWQEVFEAKLLEAVEGIDEDDLLEAIQNNLDVGELVQELMKTDKDFQAQAKAKIRALLIKEIEGCKSLEELNGSELNLSEIADEDDNNILDALIKEMIKSDEEITESLKAKLRKLLSAKIKGLSEDDVFCEDSEGNDFNFSDLFDRNEHFKAMLKSTDMQELLTGASKKLVADYIKELELDESDIPEDDLQELVAQTIKDLLAQPEFAQKIQAKIAEDLEKAILEKVADGETIEEVLDDKLKSDPRMQQLVANEAEALMRDRDFIEKIGQQVKTRLTSRGSGLPEQLLDGLVTKVAELLVTKLFAR